MAGLVPNHYTPARLFRDYAGRRFGSLVALHATIPAKGGNLRWVCRCDCGNLCVRHGITLKAVHASVSACDECRDARRAYAKQHRGPGGWDLGPRGAVEYFMGEPHEDTEPAPEPGSWELECTDLGGGPDVRPRS